VKIQTNLAQETIVLIDGDTVKLPATLGWIPDIKHKIEVPEIVLEADGQRFVFKSWSDKGVRSHSVAAKKDTIFTATYEQQFQLTVQSNPLNLVKLNGSGWYPAGTSVNLGPAPESATQSNKKFRFFFWNINQNKNTELSPRITVNERTLAVAHYLKEFFIQGMILVDEIPIPNLKVKLAGGLFDSSLTDTAGQFIFDDLKAGKYSIQVPVEGVVYDTSKAVFEITNQNITDFKLAIQDVQPPKVNLITPKGNEKLKSGDIFKIEWDATDNLAIDSVKLFLSPNNGTDWELLAVPADSDSVYNWTVPVLKSKTCLVRVEAKDLAGNSIQAQSPRVFEIDDGVSVSDDQNFKINSFQLHQNFPNPFNPATEIVFEIPAMEMVSLRIFNLTGQEIARLIQQQLPAGVHRWRWDAKNFPTGIYYCQLQAGNHQAIRRMILLR
jgi:hypothetical protein